MQDFQQRQSLGGLQGALGVLQAVRQKEEMMRQAQEAPLRLQALQAQMQEAQRKAQAAQVMDQTIAGLPPEQQALARLAPQQYVTNTMKAGEARVVPSGGVLVQNGQKVFENPRAEPKSAFEKTLDAAGITDPAQRQTLLQEYLKKQVTHAPAASTTVVMNQEKEEAKAVGKAAGESFNAIMQSGMDAGSKIARYDRIGQLLEGVSTGKLTPAATQIAAIADSLGIKIDPNLGSKQAAQALANEIALTLRNPSGGAGMPGALSDKDREFLVSMAPGLGTTPEGNRLLIETAKKLAKRDQEVSRLARQYRQKNGSFGPGFYEELQRYSEANPLFPAGAGPAAPTAPANIPRVTSDTDYNALPKGTQYVAPDGKTRVKQ